MVCRRLLFALLAAVAVWAGCKKNVDDEKPPVGAREYTVNASSYNEWHYFSFSKGKLVEVEDHTDDLGWDIAFHRGDVRTNSGLSGKGQGGAYKTNVEDLLATVPIPAADQFGIDDKPYPVLTLLDMMGSKSDRIMMSVNQVMTERVYKVVKDGKGEWVVPPIMKDGVHQKDKLGIPMYERMEEPNRGIVYRKGGMPPTYIIVKNVFIVRCADGQFAKFKLIDFLNEKNEGGYLKFHYVYPVE